MKCRKKPVVVDAVQWIGSNYLEIKDFIGITYLNRIDVSGDCKLIIPTLEGYHYASIGDWIIRGVQGEYYPCKPDIFEKTYERVTD